MKRACGLWLACLVLSSPTVWADFTAGNAVALLCTNVSTGGGGSLVEYNLVGATGYQVTLPYGATDSGNSIVFGNNSTLNHDIGLSADGAFVVVGGYANSATGVDSASGTVSPRVVALVKYDGTYSRPFSSTTVLSGTSVRSATSDGFGNFWGNGNSSVIHFNTATALPTGSSRVTTILNGNLCYSLASGAYAYSGLPTSSGSPGTLFLGSALMPPTATAAGYAIPASVAVGSIGYLVDYNGTTPGIGHFHYDGSSWVWDYNINLAGGEKPQHIAVKYGGANPIVYVTPAAASGNHLYAINDTGSATSGTPYTQSTLGTAPAGQAFRGVSMAPTAPGCPSFTASPQGQTNEYGSTVSFGPVAADGANPNGFTWMRHGTNLVDGPTGTGSVISGSTSNTLTVAGIGNADRANYYALAHNNGSCITTSSPAFLDLIGSCISPKPSPITRCAGTTATFTGGTAGCPPPINSISWIWNDSITLSDASPGPSGFSTVSGATTTTLTLSGVQDGDAGNYKMVVDANSTISVASAALTVTDPPGFSQQPAAQDKVAGQTASFTVIGTGNALSYQWKKNGGNLSDGPTGTGSTNAGAHTATLWITNVATADEGTYTCTIDNACALPATSDPATLTVGFLPSFTTWPADTNVWIGSNVVLKAVATGTPNITYAWKHNGTPLNNDGHTLGVDTDTLTITDVQIADAQTYTLTAANSYGTATAPVVVRVITAGPRAHTIPNLVIYEPFNYPVQAYPGFPAPAGWINSWQDLISAWNEATGEPAYWERLGGPYCTIRTAAEQNGFLPTGLYPWKGIDCASQNQWYWSSAPNNNHLKFGGIPQSSGAAYFSCVIRISQGTPFGGNVYDLVAGLSTGTGGLNADNWTYKLCTHTAANNTYQFGIFKGGGGTIGAGSVNGQWANVDYGNASLHFIVGCYKFNTGTNLVGGSITNDDVISLWIDPDRSTFGAAEGSLPAPSAGGMVTNWGPNAPITEFGLKGLVEPTSKDISDLRIGTTWASVTTPYYPTLKITTTPTDVTVSWPAKDTPFYNGAPYGYLLRTSSDLITWGNDNTPLVLDGTGTNWTATESLNAPQFFRLLYP